MATTVRQSGDRLEIYASQYPAYVPFPATEFMPEHCVMTGSKSTNAITDIIFEPSISGQVPFRYRMAG